MSENHLRLDQSGAHDLIALKANLQEAAKAAEWITAEGEYTLQPHQWYRLWTEKNELNLLLGKPGEKVQLNFPRRRISNIVGINTVPDGFQDVKNTGFAANLNVDGVFTIGTGGLRSLVQSFAESVGAGTNNGRLFGAEYARAMHPRELEIGVLNIPGKGPNILIRHHADPQYPVIARVAPTYETQAATATPLTEPIPVLMHLQKGKRYTIEPDLLDIYDVTLLYEDQYAPENIYDYTGPTPQQLVLPKRYRQMQLHQQPDGLVVQSTYNPNRRNDTGKAFHISEGEPLDLEASILKYEPLPTTTPQYNPGFMNAGYSQVGFGENPKLILTHIPRREDNERPTLLIENRDSTAAIRISIPFKR